MVFDRMVNATSHPQAEKIRAVRVFVSSTFVDMHEEREHLAFHVFPLLREWCMARGVFFNEIDLRWGVPRNGVPALEVCLEEVDQCRPFFVGLIGHLSGTLTDEEAIGESIDRKYPWIRSEHLLGRSYTELEMQYGVLRNPDSEDGRRSIFYFRSDAFSDRVERQLHEADLELQRKDSSTKPRGRRPTLQERADLDRLRETIKSSGLEVREAYPDPLKLGNWMLADLKRRIATEFGFDPEDPPEKVRSASWRSRKDRIFVSNRKILSALCEHSLATTPPLVILGNPGSGKSTLLRSWIGLMTGEDPCEISIRGRWGTDFSPNAVQQCRSTARSVEFATYLAPDSAPERTCWPHLLNETSRRLIRKFQLSIDLPDPTPGSARATFASVLNAIPPDHKVILCMDGIDHLEDFDPEVPFGLLPPEIPAHVRLVISCLGISRPAGCGWKFLDLPAWSSWERSRFLRLYALSFGRKFEPADEKWILKRMKGRSPLALRLIVDHLRFAIRNFREITETLLNWLRDQDEPSLLKSYLETLDRRLQESGARKDLPSQLLGLLKSSRGGLSEDEARCLLGDGNSPLPSAYWSPLLLNLSGYLIENGSKWRPSPALASLAGSDLRRNRETIARHFQKHPCDWRKAQELPFQLKTLGDRDRLEAALTNPGLLAILWKERPSEVRAYWQWLDPELSRLPEAYEEILRFPGENTTALPAVAALLIDGRHYDYAASTLAYLQKESLARRDYRIATDAAIELSWILTLHGGRNAAISLLMEMRGSIPSENHPTQLAILSRNLSKIHRQEAVYLNLTGRDPGIHPSASAGFLNEQEIQSKRTDDLSLQAIAAIDGCEALCRQPEYSPDDLSNCSVALEQTGRLLGSSEILAAALHFNGISLQARTRFKAAIAVHQKELELARDDLAEARARSALARAFRGRLLLDEAAEQMLLCEKIAANLEDPLRSCEAGILFAELAGAMNAHGLAEAWKQKALASLRGISNP